MEGSITAGSPGASGAEPRAQSQEPGGSGATNADPGNIPQVERGELPLQNGPTTLPDGQRYTVTDGDSLQTIASRFYGSAMEWERIYEANTDKLSNPDLLYPGQELVIPAGGGSPGGR
ncbi:MAG: LysM peptidoglycan-binding domain-containing protein [Dehalococcoidia bacterium]|nr:LysM peptidoglycan-binding domain-containing protein [Dehalococcoidia bacterium]